MYVLVNELMKDIHMHVEYHHLNLLLLPTVKHDINMVMVNTIPCDQPLLNDAPHQRQFDVVIVVVYSIMYRQDIVLNAVRDVNIERSSFPFLYTF
jgi:hypothetical protein